MLPNLEHTIILFEYQPKPSQTRRQGQSWPHSSPRCVGLEYFWNLYHNINTFKTLRLLNTRLFFLNTNQTHHKHDGKVCSRRIAPPGYYYSSCYYSFVSLFICVPNQSVHGKYNLISFWFNKVSKIFHRV